MKRLFLATASWIGFTGAVIVLYTGVPCLAAVNGPCASMWYFLPWPPGVATAAIAGATGAWFNSMLSATFPADEQSAGVPLEVFLAAPFLGGAAAVIVFS